ncbi:MAG: hypothetical protein AB9842_10590 [Bacteroidales bacterium]
MATFSDRKVVYAIILACILIVTLISCKKDNSTTIPVDPDPTYYFKYKGNKYEISKSLVFYDAAWGNPGLRRFKVYLTSNGIEYDQFHNKLTGNGNGLLFNLVTDNDTTFAGIYAVHPEHPIPAVDDITSPGIVFDNDFSLMDGEHITISGGTCVVSELDDICKFTFKFVTSANDSVTGGYTGNFEKY